MGTVWIMATRSGLVESLVVVVLLTLLGVAAGLRVGRAAGGKPVDGPQGVVEQAGNVSAENKPETRGIDGRTRVVGDEKAKHSPG
jgi:hypothetical protein